MQVTQKLPKSYYKKVPIKTNRYDINYKYKMDKVTINLYKNFLPNRFIIIFISSIKWIEQ